MELDGILRSAPGPLPQAGEPQGANRSDPVQVHGHGPLQALLHRAALGGPLQHRLGLRLQPLGPLDPNLQLGDLAPRRRVQGPREFGGRDGEDVRDERVVAGEEGRSKKKGGADGDEGEGESGWKGGVDGGAGATLGRVSRRSRRIKCDALSPLSFLASSNP